MLMLLVLLILARLLAEVAERLGQPSIVGELVAGILLGLLAVPLTRWTGISFDFIHEVQDTPAFEAITDLGIFFLMLLGGLELRPRDMAQASRSAVFIAVGGLVLPMLCGIGLGLWLLPDSGAKTAQTLFLGTALAITAVPVSIRVLRDLGRLDSRAGRIIVSAAVYDDVLSLVLLAVLTALLKTGQWPDAMGLLLLVGKVTLFFVLTIAVGRWVFPFVGRRLARSSASEFEFSMVLAVALAFGLLAEQLDMHFILGAFMAGLFFQRRRNLEPEIYDAVRARMDGIATGFLAPIFFASIGLHLSGGAFVEVPVFLTAVLLVAFLAKLLGCGLISLAFHRDVAGAAVVGSAMSARGAVELIIADIALRAGLFDTPSPAPPIVANLFSVVVIVAIVTTIITPVAVTWVLNRDAARNSQMLEEGGGDATDDGS